MTRAAYQQLLVLLNNTVRANPPDLQVVRLAKGLARAVERWLAIMPPSLPVQARNSVPRPCDLASVNASLASQPGAHSNAESTRADG